MDSMEETDILWDPYTGLSVLHMVFSIQYSHIIGILYDQYSEQHSSYIIPISYTYMFSTSSVFFIELSGKLNLSS
jgi:hypothetical protein